MGTGLEPLVPRAQWKLRAMVRQGVTLTPAHTSQALSGHSQCCPTTVVSSQNRGRLGMVGMTGQLEVQRFCLGSPPKHSYFLAMGPGGKFLPSIQPPHL